MRYIEQNTARRDFLKTSAMLSLALSGLSGVSLFGADSSKSSAKGAESSLKNADSSVKGADYKGTNKDSSITPITQRRKIGAFEVSAMGLGCMGMTHGHGLPKPKDEMIKLIHKARDLGINFFDTAEVYTYKEQTNEELVGAAIKGFRDKVIIGTKFGIYLDSKGNQILNSKPTQIRKAIEGSLKRLQTDYIDIYYQHRVDTSVPIEEVAGVMKDLYKEGKIRAWGLSEAGINTIKKAHKEFPLVALQSEYSMWWRELEKDFSALKERNIALVAFSPLGRGYLTGAMNENTTFGEGDFKSKLPRFYKKNLSANQIIVAFIDSIAKKKNATKAQIALAWILAQDDFIIPIFGTTSETRLIENLKAKDIALSSAEIKSINKQLDSIKISGERYPAELADRVGK